jgi:hypothetical protein
MTRHWLKSANVEIDDSTGAILVKSGGSQTGLTQGTTKTWKTTGGDYALTLDNLSNGNGRMGQMIDFGPIIPRKLLVVLSIKFQSVTAPGSNIELYWAESTDGILWPGKVTGSDAAYPGTVMYNKTQLTSIGNFKTLADPYQQTQLLTIVPNARYGAPVVVNSANNSLSNSSPSDHFLKITPTFDQTQTF